MLVFSLTETFAAPDGAAGVYQKGVDKKGVAVLDAGRC